MKKLKELKTKHKEIEHLLENSLKEVSYERDRAQKYFEVAEVMLLVLDIKGEVSLINNKGAKILGCRKKEIIGKNWFDNFLPINIKKAARAIFKQAVAGNIKAAEYYENNVLIKSGEERLIAWHNVILKDDKKNIVGLLSSGRDITEHRKANKALVNSEKKFRLLAENIPNVIYLCQNDKRYSVIYLNDKIKSVTGYSKQAFLKGKLSLAELFHPDDTDSIFKKVDSAVSEKIPFHLIYRIKHRSGEWRWVEEFGTGVFDEQTQTLQFLQGIVIDITERKHMEESIKTLSRRIIEAQDAERRKIAREVHDDLGQSLIAMKMFITNNLPETLANNAEAIEFCNNLKLHLNKNIEKARNISYNLRPHTLQVLGLSVAIKIMIENIECNNNFKINYKGLKFEQYSFQGEDINFYRIIQEALMNIVKHAQADEVNITASARDGKLKIVIEDNGKGIGERKTKSRKEVSTNLGLSIMKERAKLLGGDLNITSRKGEGTQVVLTLPVEKVKK